MAMKLDHDDLDRLIEKISTSDIQEFSLVYHWKRFSLLGDLSLHDLIS